MLAATAVAATENGVSLPRALAALVVGVSLQVGVNYANDYHDHVRGVDSAARVGPRRLAASGLVAPGRVLAASLLCLAVAAAVGVGLALATDVRLLLVGAAALAAAWLYSAGPRPYANLGLGEIFVFVFFGLVATAGTAYVEERQVTPTAFMLGLGLGCLSSAMLALNNLRDIETDARAGKRTLEVRLGRQLSWWLIAGLLAGAYVAMLAAVVAWSVLHIGSPLVLLALVSLPLAGLTLAHARSRQPRQLLEALLLCSVLELVFAGLWSIGLALGAP